MMINAALRWPNDSEKILWTIDMDNAVHLHNHTNHIESGMYPKGSLDKVKVTR